MVPISLNAPATHSLIIGLMTLCHSREQLTLSCVYKLKSLCSLQPFTTRTYAHAHSERDSFYYNSFNFPCIHPLLVYVNLLWGVPKKKTHTHTHTERGRYILYSSLLTFHIFIPFQFRKIFCHLGWLKEENTYRQIYTERERYLLFLALNLPYSSLSILGKSSIIQGGPKKNK